MRVNRNGAAVTARADAAMPLGLSRGMWHMVNAAVFFSLMSLAVRLLAGVPFMQVVVVRSAISLVLSAALLMARGIPIFGPNWRLNLARGLFGFLGLSAYFYSLQQLPLGEAVTVQYTNPLFTALFAPLILKERGTGREWLAMGVAFVGVVLIADPSAPGRIAPVVVGLAGAMCSGIAYNLVRKLGRAGEDPLTIVLYFPLVSLVLGTPLAAADAVMPDAVGIALLVAVGITTQIAQVSMTRGLRLERASRATVVNYLVIALSTLYSLLLGEQLRWAALAGMACIVAGMLIVSRAAHAHPPADASAEMETRS
jgi:drug/metabolite transporter (DMT)-like permease